MKKILIYLPALNEQDSIGAVIKSLPSEISNCETSVLVVNDGSTDNTSIIAKNRGATVINHSYNKGLSQTLQSAIEYSLKHNFDFMVSIDADGQFSTADISKLLNPLIIGSADFSIGNRFSNGRPNNMPKVKYYGNAWVSKIVSGVSGQKIADASCGFRAYSRNAMLNLNLLGRFTYTHETILDLLDKNLVVAQIDVQVSYFKERTSRIANNVWSYGLRIVPVIFKCLKDYRPFRFFMTLAFIVFALSMAIGGFVAIHWFQNGEITPYKSFGIFALAIFGFGVLLTVLALVADMMNRIRRNQEKVLFLLKENFYDQN